MLVIGAALLLAFVVCVALGARTPRDHVATLSRTYGVPARALYELLRDEQAYPAWRSGVRAVKQESAQRYVEYTRHGAIPYRILEDAPYRRLVVAIDDPKLPFAGTWTFDIVEDAGCSQLRITEHGSVANPLVRFFARYVMGEERTIRTYLADVGKRLGEQACR